MSNSVGPYHWSKNNTYGMILAYCKLILSSSSCASNGYLNDMNRSSESRYKLLNSNAP